ncbi:ATP-binding protein [Oscillatoria sp. FACHB-1406]|uniref:AAA family ATPase n=1 Tax=Oscillatoria sp. FACHB-1406 TaxID=2692846 RepID=UPI001687FFF4|nr:ATP-binding protein [Oscillatoria sp. FACHB-1406]MBD2577978.1 ATP-binding protein [Oscillatoria sp. FACHB-1406]
MSQPRLLSFTLDNWTALGGRVSVSLVDRVAVLVGRNGAGKSAILEGFEAISSCAIGRTNRRLSRDNDSIPRMLEIEILTPSERHLRYQYELIISPTFIEDSDFTELDESDNDNVEENSFSWNECCQYLDGKQEFLWETQAGITTLHNSENPIITILGNMTSLRQSNLPENSQLKLPVEMQWVYAVLKGVRILGKASIRQTLRRRPSFLKVSSKGISSGISGLADSLTRKVIRRIEKNKEDLDELENVCQRVGLGNKITVQKFVLSEESLDKKTFVDEEYVSSVLLDGVNFGLLSEGTLRVLSIIIEIISPYPNATTILEEPETQIHPLMLEKLLNELETYTFEDNLILSTHSPQVVAWTIPERIHLVYRKTGRTTVRKLQEEEIEKVVAYLSEEGDLGDWLYSGILDE